jgi:hypothetical protein
VPLKPKSAAYLSPLLSRQISHEFRGDNSVRFFPPGFCNDCGNLQSRSIPDFLKKPLEDLKTEILNSLRINSIELINPRRHRRTSLSSDDEDEVEDPSSTLVKLAVLNYYSTIKNDYRSGKSRFHDARGVMTAMCATPDHIIGNASQAITNKWNKNLKSGIIFHCDTFSIVNLTCFLTNSQNSPL